MTPEVLVSTGAFVGRPNGRDHKLLFRVVPELQADGYEFMIYDTWYGRIREIVEDLLPLGIRVPVIHAEKSIGHLMVQDEQTRKTAIGYFRENLMAAERFGAEKMVLHLWNGPSLDTEIEKNYQAFAILDSMAKDSGVKLTVENVVTFGKEPEHPLDYMEELVRRYPDISFTFDVKMAAFHQQNEMIWLPRWKFLWEEGRVAHLHVSDYGGGFMDWQHLKTRHLGEGNIDFEAFFRNYNQTPRCDTATLECLSFREDGTLDIPSMNRSIQKLRALLAF